jgi:ribonuclease R
MSIRDRILGLLKSTTYQPLKPRRLARELELDDDAGYPQFKEALRDLEDEGIVSESDGGLIVLAVTQLKPGELLGLYSGNKKGFGFLDIREPVGHPQLFVPGEFNSIGAVSGDVVKARRVKREGKMPGDLEFGRIVAIVKRAHSRVVGSVKKVDGKWYVLPDGNIFPEPIETPDAAGKYLKEGTKVVVDITRYPGEYELGAGVISEVLGERGEKDVDLKSMLVQYNLPESFPEEVAEAARQVVARFDPESERARRLDLTREVILTIDPDDAKDYDDAISLHRTTDGHWELGVHIADVSYFVKEGTPLDVEAQHRGNSAYFPGYVVPMLPEVLSNGVCSLQEGVPRLVKSAFITIDSQSAKPIRTRFSNSIIRSAKRLRYREAQALIDGAEKIPHPNGERTAADYAPEVLKLLQDLNELARHMHKRRQAAGQLSLDLPKVDLVLNDVGKVVDAQPEDDAFTHTLIEMFMVEANEAVARLFQKLDVPAIRRIHPEPDPDASARLGRFIMVAGHKLPSDPTRHDLQKILKSVHGKPEAFAINMAVLKSLARAEYSPEIIGHYALASDHYTHFTSPIRRYADLMVHRLLDAWFEAIDADFGRGPIGFEPATLRDVPTVQDLLMQGQHLSFTERRAESAERELRQVKLLELMEKHIDEQFPGVVTAITKFGIFIQLDKWLVEGLVRYQGMLGDFWEVDERGGVVRGRRTGQRIHVGDVATVRVARVDHARRELNLEVIALRSRGTQGAPLDTKKRKVSPSEDDGTSRGKKQAGATRRSQRSRTREQTKRVDTKRAAPKRAEAKPSGTKRSGPKRKR